MTLTVAEAGRALADPLTYADDDRLYRAVALLRREAPVSWVEAPGYHPFWAITRHADIREIERRSDIFRNAPRPLLVTARMDEINRQSERRGAGLRPLVHLDGDRHALMRSMVADRFRPQAIEALEPRIRRAAEKAVGRMARSGGTCEFVGQVGDPYALDVLLSLLGLDESEFGRVFRFTPAARRAMPLDDRHAAMRDFYAYFRALAAERRRNPAGDLASVIANARVDGRLLDDDTLLSHYIIILTAGHDTASTTIAGGLRALIEHPGRLRQLREDPALLTTAAEEMIRWVTPVKAFMRTAVADHTLRGVRVRKGESVLLSYPSANRDPAVFDRPDDFDVRRTPNRHLAFGYGVHHCLGAALARLEIKVFFEELLPRLESAELAGEPRQLRTTFSGGLKHLPVRYTMTGEPSRHSMDPA